MGAPWPLAPKMDPGSEATCRVLIPTAAPLPCDVGKLPESLGLGFLISSMRIKTDMTLMVMMRLNKKIHVKGSDHAWHLASTD